MGDTDDGGSTKENDILAGEEVDDDTESEPHVGEREPREDQREDVVLT